jgi:hypothetical protein
VSAIFGNNDFRQKNGGLRISSFSTWRNSGHRADDVT